MGDALAADYSASARGQHVRATTRHRAADVPIITLNVEHEIVTLGAGTEITTGESMTTEQAPLQSNDQLVRGDIETAIRAMVAEVSEGVPEQVRAELAHVKTENASAFSFGELNVGYATAWSGSG